MVEANNERVMPGVVLPARLHAAPARGGARATTLDLLLLLAASDLGAFGVGPVGTLPVPVVLMGVALVCRGVEGLHQNLVPANAYRSARARSFVGASMGRRP